MGRRAKMGAGQLQGMSRQQVSGAVKVALEAIGVDPKHYSGISMRRGGCHGGGTCQDSSSHPTSAKRSRHGDVIDGIGRSGGPSDAVPDGGGDLVGQGLPARDTVW